jgi:hypothetical protein
MGVGARTSAHDDTSRRECGTLREAEKHLRTCCELWPDNKPAWCKQCLGAPNGDAVIIPRSETAKTRWPRT